MGLVNLAAAGLGTVRADIAGFFIGGGIIQIVAAIRRDPDLVGPGQRLVLLARMGRAITLIIDGPVAAGIPSMGIELVLLVLLLWCKKVWHTQPV